MFSRKSILISFLLLLPAIIVYVNYFINSTADSTPSGFIQSDMYSYMAEARQYADGESNGLFYSNPFDGDKNAPKIYFQPQILLLGIILKYTSINPSNLFLLFGFIFGWIFMISAVTLYRQFFDLKSMFEKLGLFVFIYGGGALFISGSVWMFFNGFNQPNIEFFRYDPGYGWWMLNLGRNLIYPLESYYHFLVLIAFVMFFKQKHLWVCVVLLVLSWSHPFYGIEFLSVFGLIYLFEFIRFRYLKQKDKKHFLPLLLISVMFSIHIFYYLLYLPSFPSHQLLMNQWKINWSHSGITLIFAYIFGALLTIISIYQKGGFIVFFLDNKNRVLGIWFIVCFLFVNHNWFIESYQPLHFDKGYVLAPLWLMGLPSLFFILRKYKDSVNLLMFRLSLVLIVVILLSDNISWFLKARSDSNSYIKNSEKEVLNYLDTHFTKQNLLLTKDDDFSSKAMVFTSMRALVSHGYNTPSYNLKRMEMDSILKTGKILSSFTDKQSSLILVIPNFSYLQFDTLRNQDKIVFKTKDLLVLKFVY